MIQFLNENIEFPSLDQAKITTWIKKTALEYGKKVGDINYIFCNDEKILEVNKQYLQHDYYTDIITFDYSQGKIIASDIFISLETVKSNSEQFGTNYQTELHRVIIHGILHLCGQDDQTPTLREEMIAKENKALNSL